MYKENFFLSSFTNSELKIDLMLIIREFTIEVHSTEQDYTEDREYNSKAFTGPVRRFSR